MKLILKKYISLIKVKYNEDYKKFFITSVLLVALLIKIVFPEICRLIGSKQEIELNQIEHEKNVTEKELNFENSEDIDVVKVRKNESEKMENITVYITGAVSNPGVITISSDKRLDDVIKMSGGLTKDADYERVNLAMKIEDSQHYIIPYKGDNNLYKTNNGNNVSSGGNLSNTISSSSNAQLPKININKADQNELENIPGVGPSTAKKIIDYRLKEGSFSSINDIKKVTGIGEKKFESMKDYIDIK